MNNDITTYQSNHPKHILNQIKNTAGLPFEQVLSSSDIYKHDNSDRKHERIFSTELVIRGFLLQAIGEDQSCQAAVVQIVAFFSAQEKETPSANTAAYCKARTRLSNDVLPALAKEQAQKIENQTVSNWLWRNRNIRLIDGTTVSMGDTSANQEKYPQAKAQEKGLGFPIARIVAIISYATGVVLDAAIGPYSGKETGEHALLRQIFNVFQAGDILLGDRYYGSFFLLAKLKAMGIDAVFPMHHGRHYDFSKGTSLGKKDHIAIWIKPKKPTWMSHEEYNTYPHEIEIREVEIKNSQPGFRTKSRVFVTTFLDDKSVKKSDINILYDYRWCVEIDLRAIKETMNMNILRGKTPEIVVKEIWAHFLAYNLVRGMMANAARKHTKHPRHLSFKLTLQVIFAYRNAFMHFNSDGIYNDMLKAIAYKTVGNRSGRVEPRKVKRRPKKHRLMVKSRFEYHMELLNH